MSVLPPNRGGEPARPDRSKEEQGPLPSKGASEKKFVLPKKEKKKEEAAENESDEKKKKRNKEGQNLVFEHPAAAWSPPPPPPPPSSSGSTTFSKTPGLGRSNERTTSSNSFNQTENKESSSSSSSSSKTSSTQNEKEEREEKQSQDTGLAAAVAKEIEVTFGENVGIKGTTDITKIAELIKKMVETLHTGTVKGEKITSLELKKGELPDAFSGTTLTIRETQQGIVISFSNFATGIQEGKALSMIERGQQQLTQLIQGLHAKNISIAAIQVGNRFVNLSEIPTGSVKEESFQQQGEGGRDQQQKDQKEQEQEKSKKIRGIP